MDLSKLHSKRAAGIVAKRPTIDRYTTTIDGVYEWLVSVRHYELPDGRICLLVSLDMVMSLRQPILSMPIARFPIAGRDDAIADARLISSYYGVGLRIQDLKNGWIDDLEPLRHPMDPSHWIV